MRHTIGHGSRSYLLVLPGTYKPKGGTLCRRDSEKKTLKFVRRSERSRSSGRGVLRTSAGTSGLRPERAKNSRAPLRHTSNRIYRPPLSHSRRFKIKLSFNCQFRILLCSIFERVRIPSFITFYARKLHPTVLPHQINIINNLNACRINISRVF